MQKDFDKWIAEIKNRRSEQRLSEDIRNAIDIILKHVDTHGDNLWGDYSLARICRWWYTTCSADKRTI
jgi:hypothetical protein